MTVVGVHSNPSRAAHVRAYLRSTEPWQPSILIATDPDVRTSLDLPESTEIVPRGGSPSGSKDRLDRLRTWLLARTRAGSEVGRWLESAARRTKRAIPARRGASPEPTRETAAPIDRALIETLETIHDRARISTIVAFDLQDLSSIQEFARQRDVAVLVR